jgi:hypothetical protein
VHTRLGSFLPLAPTKNLILLIGFSYLMFVVEAKKDKVKILFNWIY